MIKEEREMDEKKMVELDDSLMDEVSGGIRRPIKTGTNDKAQVRSSPTTAAHNQQDSLVNGTIVDTFGSVEYDPASDRHFVQIRYEKNGVTLTGWIATSFVGMGR